MNKILSYGHVNSDGELSIYNKGDFVSRIEQYFSNTSVEIIVQDRFYEFSNDHRGYYFAVIVREYQKAYMCLGEHRSLNSIDDELRNRFLFYEVFDDEEGKYVKNIHTLRKGETKVSKSEMKWFCEMCIMWAVQNLDWAIPYPNELLSFEDKTETQLRVENMREKLSRTN